MCDLVAARILAAWKTVVITIEAWCGRERVKRGWGKNGDPLPSRPE